MRLPRLSWVLALVVLGCAAPDVPGELGAARAPIINGTRERGYPQVVAVARLGEKGGLCSGTVIGPFAVLTAKHCVFTDNGDGTHTAVRASELLVVTGHNISAPEETSNVYEVRTTPGSDVDRDVMYGNDIAILLLPADIGIAPHGTAESGPPIGEPITIVGFGRTMGGAPMEGDAGLKYRGSTRVSDTGMRLFETRGEAWT
jgi:hypothetical protein